MQSFAVIEIELQMSETMLLSFPHHPSTVNPVYQRSIKIYFYSLLWTHFCQDSPPQSWVQALVQSLLSPLFGIKKCTSDYSKVHIGVSEWFRKLVMESYLLCSYCLFTATRVKTKGHNQGGVAHEQIYYETVMIVKQTVRINKTPRLPITKTGGNVNSRK